MNDSVNQSIGQSNVYINCFVFSRTG